MRGRAENPFLRNSTPAPIPAAKPKSPATAVTSPPPRRITMRSGQPRKASAPTITIIPAQSAAQAPSLPARGTRARRAPPAWRRAPARRSPGAGTAPFPHCAGRARPRCRAGSTRYKAHVGGIARRRQDECRKATITPVPATRYLLLLITFSLVFCFADTAVLHLHSGVIH